MKRRVNPAFKPWLSTADIDKGARWASDVAERLETARAGIICLTPSNLHAAWLLWEAGALSKTIKNTHVCTLHFTESCRKLCLHEIERYDLLKFAGFLRDEKNQSPRSVYNKFETVMAFLKVNGIRGLVGKNDWPRYTEEEPEMYEQDELDKLFKACSANGSCSPPISS